MGRKFEVEEFDRSQKPWTCERSITIKIRYYESLDDKSLKQAWYDYYVVFDLLG